MNSVRDMVMWALPTVLGAALLVGAGASQAVAAPITFNTALPVSDEEVLLRQQIHYTHASDRLAGTLRDVSVWKSVTAVGYGVTHKFAVFGVAPVIAKDTRTGPVKRDVSGLADIKIFGRYQLYRKDGPGTTTRLAPFFGVRLPTGRTGKTSDGSTDYFGGAVLTRATTYWNLDAQAQYTHNGRHGGFERGDESRLDASVQYRINAHDGNVNNHGYLFTVLEAGLVYADKNDIGGNADLNSGGRTAFIAPGLQYAAKRWIGEAAIKVPIMKDLNGNALQPGVTMITSIRVNF